ncbi:terminase small subunit, partial [Escherichia coli]|uniref:terminase small subunit n=1 Tax=Escherichia coli TaxID=562 RepID=UPI001FCE45AB
RHRLTRAQADAQELKNARDSAEVVETAFCTFVLSRIAGEIASILDGIPLNRPGFLESVLSVNSGCQIIVSDGS